ncbi:FecR family protein [Sphingobacterium humi]|uniref:DUF4974 domain-containing protein n=1 Tax=Sphingobacterium humi TaxID=1796905 RepID=A0A6N8KYU3_9SPHI|nr:FecR family protein [Sphingobacterium humi]MVZ62653.1 DUF4974 domain-containing protein [Sphingobacterium humi]
MGKTIQELFAKIQAGTASEQELESFRELLKTIPEEEYQFWLDQWTSHMEQASEAPVHQPRPIAIRWVGLAAAVLLIAIAFYFPFSNNTDDQLVQVDSIIAAPASDKAVLKLASGQEFKLDKEGDILRIHTEEVLLGGKTLSTSLGQRTTAIQYHEIQTPKGGTMKVELPDGSLVHLNANSTLRFRADFQTHREVYMTGELFFEVKRDENHPFLVHTQKQTVKVLGTSFNISTYEGDDREETTVASGLVEVAAANQKVLLKPNQQAMTAGNALRVAEVDLASILDWVSNEFVFKNATVLEVMQEYERWYDLDINLVNPKELETIRLWGNVKRSLNAYKALEQLSYFDILFEVKSEGGNKKINIYKR